MRTFPVLAALLTTAITGLAACTDESTTATSPGTDGGSDSAPNTDEDAGDDDAISVAFDACTVLTQTEAQDVIAYTLTPSRKEVVNDAVRHVWESPADAPLSSTGSVNVTVDKKGKSFDEVTILCGTNGEKCIQLDGVGEKASLNLKYTTVYVKKGDAVFAAQCERPGQIMAAEDAVIQEKLTAENKEADLTIRSDGSEWRNSSSCSLAIAKIIAGKLP